MREKGGRWRRRGLVLLCLALGLAVYVIANAVSILAFSSRDQKTRADAAIVLGAATHAGQVSPVYRARLDHAVALYRAGYVDKLIVTGGTGAGETCSDGAAAQGYVLSQGVPAEDVLVEDRSTITQENLENARELMAGAGCDTAILVSDPLHMKRAMLLARDAGIRAYSSPTPTSRYVTWRTKLPFLARETFFYIGYRWYRLLPGR